MLPAANLIRADVAPTPEAATESGGRDRPLGRWVTGHLTRSEWGVAIFVLLLLCLGLRVRLIINTDVIQRDGTLFVRMARSWLEDPRGVIGRENFHVGYPALMAYIHGGLERWLPAGVAGWELVGQSISLVSALITTVGLLVLAQQVFGNGLIALASVCVFSASRKWVMLGADVMSDSLALMFQIWAIVLAIHVARSLRFASRWLFAWAGLVGSLAGLGYLVRPEAMAPAVLACLLWLIVMWFPRMSERDWRLMQVARRDLSCPAAAPRGKQWAVAATCMAVCLLIAAMIGAPYMAEIGTFTKKKNLTEMAIVGPASPFAVVAQATAPTARAAATLAAPSKTGTKKTTGDAQADGRTSVRLLLDQTVESAHGIVFGFFCVFLFAGVIHALAQHDVIKTVPWPRPYWPEPLPVPVVMLLITTATYGLALLRLRDIAGYLDWRHTMLLGMFAAALCGAGIWISANFFGCLVSRAKLPTTVRPATLLALFVGLTAVLFTVNTANAGAELHGGKEHILRAVAGIKTREAGDGNLRLLTNDAWVLHYADLPQGLGGTFSTANLKQAGQMVRRFEASAIRPTVVVLSRRWIARDQLEPFLAALGRRGWKVSESIDQVGIPGDKTLPDKIYILVRTP